LTRNKFSDIFNHMVKYYPDSLDATFAALADPTRRAILARLALGEASVTELAEPFSISLPAISKHLRVLERAGLLAREKDGRIYRCHLVAEPLKGAAEWIARYQRFWQEQFDNLAEYLNETMEEEKS
jgi:DNA-binding transcriptional ArsR family regulator